MLKGRRFEDMENLKRNLTKELLALHADEFKSVSSNFMREHKSV
jgi:AAA+ ATPase superfamily predicted ATPase